MPTPVVFDLISRLVDVCTDAAPPDVFVYDGQGAAEDPGNYVMIGVPDPFSDQQADSGSGAIEWAGLGAKAAYEEGTVSSAAVFWSGDVGNDAQRAVRESVRDVIKAFDDAFRADPNLGGVVTGLEWVRIGKAYQLTQLSATDGTLALFQFDIYYRARLT